MRYSVSKCQGIFFYNLPLKHFIKCSSENEFTYFLAK